MLWVLCFNNHKKFLAFQIRSFTEKDFRFRFRFRYAPSFGFGFGIGSEETEISVFRFRFKFRFRSITNQNNTSENWKKKMWKHHIYVPKIEKMNFSPNFLCFLDLTRCLGAALNPLAGRMRPAGHVFEVPGLVVKADGSRSWGHGFEPRHHILDGCKQC
jgi:hypothetical protein